MARRTLINPRLGQCTGLAYLLSRAKAKEWGVGRVSRGAIFDLLHVQRVTDCGVYTGQIHLHPGRSIQQHVFTATRRCIEDCTFQPSFASHSLLYLHAIPPSCPPPPQSPPFYCPPLSPPSAPHMSTHSSPPHEYTHTHTSIKIR